METDRNFLCGLAAVQSGLIDASQLVEAGIAWLGSPHRPLIDLLTERGWVSEQGRSTLEARVRDLERSTFEAQRSTVPPASDRPSDGLSTFAYQPPSDPGDDRHRRTGRPEDAFGARHADAVVHATGGIGRVWRVTDTVLGRQVALKEVRPDRLAIPAIGRRFLEEARITAQLEHPNIIPVHDLMEWSARPYYTMRFLGDATLMTSVRDYHRKHEGGELPPAKLRGLMEAFIGVCNAVAFAHSRGVIHRDLKGQNVILGEFGEVIVLDWGLAKRLGSPDDPLAEAQPRIPAGPDASMGGTMPGQAIGTPNYMPPEQAAGDLARVNERSDVFGLGAMLYLILTGRAPYQGRDVLEVIREAIEAQPMRPRALNPKAPAALEAICRKAMRPRPEDRYDSAGAMAMDVKRWLADEPVAAHREAPIERLGRWSRNHRPLVASAAVFLVATTVAAGVGAFFVGRERDETRTALGRSEQNVKALQTYADRTFHDVTTSVLPNVPGVDALRGRVVGETMTLYRTLLETNGFSNPALLGPAALRCREAGNLHRGSRDLPRADGCYAQAASYLRRIGRPGVSDRMLLVGTLLDWGESEQLDCRHDEAGKHFGEALKLAEALRRDDPDDPRFRSLEARCLAHQGDNEAPLGRPAEALARLGRAVETYRTLADGPKPGRYDTLELILSLNRYARLLRREGRIEPARSIIAESLGRARGVLKRPSATNDDRFAFCLALREQAKLAATDPKHRDEADAALTEAIDTLRGLARDFSAFLSYQETLAGLLDARGEIRSSGRAAEAEIDFHASLACLEAVRQESPGYRGLEADFGRVLGHLGLLAEGQGDVKSALGLLDQSAARMEAAAKVCPNDREVKNDERRFLAERSRLREHGRKPAPR